MLLFATSAQAWEYALDDFSTTDWGTSSGWGSCNAYSQSRPCISNGSYFSVDSGDVVFSYSYANIYDVVDVSDMSYSYNGSKTYYISFDAMVGPRNSEQGNKSEALSVTVYYKKSDSSIIGYETFSQSITNTSMETFEFELSDTMLSNSNLDNIQIIISGRDGGYWNGNYGMVVANGSVQLTDYDPTSSSSGSSSATPVYSSGITSTQSTKRTSKLNDTASHGMEAHVNVTGNSNVIDIDQHDAEHYLELTIIGNSNTVDIDQDTDANATHFSDVIVDGNSNTLDLLQTGSGGKTAFIGVDGNSNTVDVIQKDSGQHYLQLDLIGDGHDATIIQEGSGSHDATIELENGGGAWDFNLNQKGTTDKEYSLPHSMGDGSTTSGTCYVAAGCSLTVIQDD